MVKKIFAKKQPQTSPAEKQHDQDGGAKLCDSSAFAKESTFLVGVKHQPGNDAH
jgi:hypothetical protein